VNKNENDCEDMQRWDEDLNKGDQKKRNDDNSLPFHHEGPSSIFLQELACKESYNHLNQVEIDEN